MTQHDRDNPEARLQALADELGRQALEQSDFEVLREAGQLYGSTRYLADRGRRAIAAALRSPEVRARLPDAPTLDFAAYDGRSLKGQKIETVPDDDPLGALNDGAASLSARSGMVVLSLAAEAQLSQLTLGAESYHLERVGPGEWNVLGLPTRAAHHFALSHRDHPGRFPASWE